MGPPRFRRTRKSLPRSAACHDERLAIESWMQRHHWQARSAQAAICWGPYKPDATQSLGWSADRSAGRKRLSIGLLRDRAWAVDGPARGAHAAGPGHGLRASARVGGRIWGKRRASPPARATECLFGTPRVQGHPIAAQDCRALRARGGGPRRMRFSRGLGSGDGRARRRRRRGRPRRRPARASPRGAA